MGPGQLSLDGAPIQLSLDGTKWTLFCNWNAKFSTSIIFQLNLHSLKAQDRHFAVSNTALLNQIMP